MDWGLTNTSPFTNLQFGVYWSGTEYAPGSVPALSFYFGQGYQSGVYMGGLYVWAVRDASAVVPEPATVALLGIGLAGLAGGAVRRRLKKVKL